MFTTIKHKLKLFTVGMKAFFKDVIAFFFGKEEKPTVVDKPLNVLIEETITSEKNLGLMTELLSVDSAWKRGVLICDQMRKDHGFSDHFNEDDLIVNANKVFLKHMKAPQPFKGLPFLSITPSLDAGINGISEFHAKLILKLVKELMSNVDYSVLVNDLNLGSIRIGSFGTPGLRETEGLEMIYELHRTFADSRSFDEWKSDAIADYELLKEGL